MKLAGVKSMELAHEESVWTAAWIPPTDSRSALILTGSLDETVKLWRPDELNPVGTNTGHCLGVVSVAAHPSGSLTASASLDSFVRVFDVDSNATITTLEAPPSEVWQMQFNPKGTILAVAGGACGSVDGTVSVFDVARAKFLHHLEGHSMSVRSLVFSPVDARMLCTASDDTHVILHDAEGRNFR
uniref:Uncharacterized protein n=1 Tax=Kalanchoe fedtschenkoi TaxID=63787 RepID=A0A7N0VIT2_KALFE